MTATKLTQSVLVDFMLLNHDDYISLSEAARLTNNENYKQVFVELAKKRLQCREELKNQLNTLGLNAKEEMSLKGYMDKFWFKLNTLLSRNSAEALLAECIKLEDEAIKEYNTALDLEGLSEECYTILQNQIASIDTAMRKSLESMASKLIAA